MVTGQSGVPHPSPQPNLLSRGPTRYFNVQPGAEDLTLEMSNSYNTHANLHYSSMSAISEE